VRPLTPKLGAAIQDVKLADDMSDELFHAIYQAFLRYQVLLFPPQDVPPGRQVAFARRFGEVQIHIMNQYHADGFPELYRLSNLDAEGKPSGKHPDKGTLAWHTDGSWQRVTGQATIIYGEVMPEIGGETHFADMYGAYERLSPEWKARIANMRAVHNLDFSRTRRHGEDPMTEAQRREKPPVDQPVVRTHPETGRKALYTSDAHTAHIEGWTEKESLPLLRFLWEHQTRPEFTCRFRWDVGSLAFWDNRSAMHNPINDYHGYRRVMHRVTLAGDKPR
jgi:taurine dioxygenase